MSKYFNISSIILLLASACTNTTTEKRLREKPELKVMTLQAHSVTIPQEYVCEISAVEYVEIHARVQGYLEEIYIDEGQWVKKGQPLFRISSNDYKEMVTRAEANLQRAIAEAKTKSLEVDRIKIMVDKNVISDTELEVANAKKDAAESGIREAQSILENARINLNYTFIRAPFEGIIDRIPFKIGSLINSGTLLTSVSNIDEVFAYFKVSEAEYLKFLGKEIKGRKFEKEHQKVSLELADGSAYPLDGYIEIIEGDIDRSTGSIAFRARFANPNAILKHGSSGKILMNKTWPDAILIPQESAFTIQDKIYVFRLDQENIAHAKSFTTLERYNQFFVTNGLQAGDKIVVEGLQQIKDGEPITPRFLPPDSVRLTQLK